MPARLITITQATVVGVCILSENPQEYCTMPFVVSGTCSQGTVEMQEELITVLQLGSHIIPKKMRAPIVLSCI